MSLKPNGVIWESNIIPGIPNAVFYGSTWGNSLFVATGSTSQNATPQDGLIYTSSDGINWTSRLSGNSNTRISGVTWSGNKFVAVGYSTTNFPNNVQGKSFTSSDGITWSNSNVSLYYELRKVTNNKSIFVAVGRENENGAAFGGIIVTSNDGISWTLRSSRTFNELQSVVSNDSIFVAVGSNGTIITSDDGISWTLRTSSTAARLDSVIWTGSRFVASGQTDIIASDDGINWSTLSSLPQNTVRQVGYNGKIYITCGFSSNIYTSSDAVNWTPRTIRKTIDSDINFNSSVIVIPARSGEVFINKSYDSISLNDIQNEFGGVPPTSINEYYAGGSYVPSGTSGINGTIPSSGQISFDQFYGSELSNTLSVLRTISVAGGSGAGSQIVPGAKYAIATPNNLDSLAPRVDIAANGLVSWPSSATNADISGWIFQNPDPVVFNDPMTITVVGEHDYVSPRLALVASGSGTPTQRGDNTFRLDVSGLSSTSNVLVFARCTKYVGLGSTSASSVEFLCEDATTVFYKIYATNTSGDYWIDNGNVRTIQKGTNWIWRLTPTKDNSHGQVITSPINDPYVCLNLTKSPVSTTFVLSGTTYSALTAAGIKVNGTSVTVGMFTMFTNYTGTLNDVFANAQFNNYLLLIP
jgi:hypothetical protein